MPVRLRADDPPVWCKLEYLNPSGSTKDRIAAYILREALASGRVRPGQTVIEASSGSTSIAFALACAQRGLRFVAVMPEGVSNERVLMIRALGGEVRFTAQGGGVVGAITESERLARECDAFLPCQFANPDNSRAHELGTAREIMEQLPAARLDAVVSGVGTGGTLVGLYQGLRPANPHLRAVLARPVCITEKLDTECCSFGTQIPGVVDGVSKLFRPELFSDLITVEVRQEEAIDAARLLIAQGFPVGPSSGLNYIAATAAARQLGGKAEILTVFPDRMERYFTTKLFDPYRSAV